MSPSDSPVDAGAAPVDDEFTINSDRRRPNRATPVHPWSAHPPDMEKFWSPRRRIKLITIAGHDTIAYQRCRTRCGVVLRITTQSHNHSPIRLGEYEHRITRTPRHDQWRTQHLFVVKKLVKGTPIAKNGVCHTSSSSSSFIRPISKVYNNQHEAKHTRHKTLQTRLDLLYMQCAKNYNNTTL